MVAISALTGHPAGRSQRRSARPHPLRRQTFAIPTVDGSTLSHLVHTSVLQSGSWSSPAHNKQPGRQKTGPGCNRGLGHKCRWPGSNLKNQ